MRRSDGVWSRAVVLAPLLAAGLLAGCAPATMRVPEALVGSAPLAVEGRQGLRVRERLRFGAFEAIDVRRSWVRGSDWRVLAYEREKRDQTFAFTLAEGGASRWRTDCRARLRTRAIDVAGVEVRAEDRTAIDCSMLSPSGERWVLSLTEQHDRPLVGTLSGASRTFEVTGSNRLEGSPLPVQGASGYEIRAGGRVAAAVEVLNEGRVWIASPGDEALLAATAAAVLLIEDLRAALE